MITLHLTNMAALTIDLSKAGIAPGRSYTVDVQTDGPVAITLGARTLHLAPGASQLHEA